MVGPHLTRQSMSDREGKSRLGKNDQEPKNGFEEKGPNHETAQRNEKPRRGIDAERS